MRGLNTIEGANSFLREHYIQEFNGRFQVTASQAGTAFVPRSSQNLDLIFSLQSERNVNRDNTVSFQNLVLQLQPVGWRATLAGCKVRVHQHLDGTITLMHGPQQLGRYSHEGKLQVGKVPAAKAMEKPRGGKVKTTTFPPRLESPQSTRASHFPTASTTAAG